MESGIFGGNKMIAYLVVSFAVILVFSIGMLCGAWLAEKDGKEPK